MKTSLLTMSLLAATLAGRASAAELSFREAKVGELAAGWSAAHTGAGQGSVWKVVADQDSPDGGQALAQVSDRGSGGFFNLCVANDTSFQDVDLALSFKAIAGKEDQGGGPVWRYQDAKNYYVARMNPLEDNFRVYKVVDGKRMQLGSADIKAAAGKWHTIRIVHSGSRIQCYLNGQEHLHITDEAIAQAGKIGLWTKADAQTRFAGIKVSDK